MSLFAAFNIILFVLGIFLWNSTPKKRLWILIFICLLMAFAYYYLDKI